jgi:hypothetical protein
MFMKIRDSWQRALYIYLRTFLLAEDTIIFMAPIKHEIQWFSTIKNSFSNGSDELLLFATITDP